MIYFTEAEIKLLDKIAGNCAYNQWDLELSIHDDRTIDISIRKNESNGADIITKTHSLEIGLESALEKINESKR